MLDSVLLIIGSLVGFSAFAAILVNIGKWANIVKDDDADKWVAGINLIGVLALYGAMTFIPNFDPSKIDTALMEIANVATYMFSFVLMLFGSRLTYIRVKNLPVIGTSFSPNAVTKLLGSSKEVK